MNIGKKHNGFEQFATPRRPGICSSACTVVGMLLAGVAILIAVALLAWGLIEGGVRLSVWMSEADVRAVIGGVGGSAILIVLLVLAAKRAFRGAR